jgi:hypothetical protein
MSLSTIMRRGKPVSFLRLLLAVSTFYCYTRPVCIEGVCFWVKSRYTATMISTGLYNVTLYCILLLRTSILLSTLYRQIAGYHKMYDLLFTTCYAAYDLCKLVLNYKGINYLNHSACTTCFNSQ